MATINFITGNPHKALEVKHILSEYNIEVRVVNYPKIEIQSDTLEKIACYAALQAAIALNIPVVVEDSGLFICSLNGFPGPYSAYVYKTIGLKGVLKLMENVKDRRAKFVCVVAYAEPGGYIKLFKGKAEGYISYTIRGKGGFGYDPIFIPVEFGNKTYAELTLNEKCSISHRGKAFRKFAKWFTSERR